MHPRHGDHCGVCGDRLPQGIAWEDARYGPLAWRYLLTLRDVFVRPRIAFPGPTQIGPALLFAALGGVGLTLTTDAVWLVLPLRFGLMSGWYGGHVWAVAALIAFALASTTTLAFGLASSFGLGLLVVGRRRGLMRIGVRASAYSVGMLGVLLTAGVMASFTAVMVGMPRDAVQVAWIAVAAVWPPLMGRIFVAAAQGLGLGTGRAIIAALGPTVLVTIPAALLIHMQLGLMSRYQLS